MKEKRTAEIFIDFSNYYYAMKKESWEIDWGRFGRFFDNEYHVIRMYYYDGIKSKTQYLEKYPAKNQRDFNTYKKKKKAEFAVLRNYGYQIVSKTVSRIYDRRLRRHKHKCNFDVELTIDALKDIANYEEIVLCSGDGDFYALLKYLKGKGRRATVVASQDSFSSSLAKAAHQVIYLQDIKSDIKR